MKNFLHILTVTLLSLLVFCACGKKPTPKTLVEITGPAGLECEISGIKLTGSPKITFRLPAGEYVFGFSAPGYRMDFRKLTIPQAARHTYKVSLEPVTAAALIKSVPAGAKVTMNGKNMGITPLVIRDLPMGTHRAELSMAGYAAMPLTWEITSERPVAATARLDSNQGALRITSTPSKARVYINGTQVGVTPYLLQRAEGRYVVRLEREGCNPEERPAHILKAQTGKLHIKLGEKPGAVAVRSNPAGAELFINNVKRGVTPCVVEALEPGEYTLRLTRAGYDPVESKVRIVPGATDKKNFTLVSSTGSVIFNVKPVGVEVSIDGKSLGVTRPIAPGAEATRDFRVDNLAPGTHVITMYHSLGDPPNQRHTFKIQKNKTVTIRNLEVWIANCEVTYLDNSRERGFLVDSNDKEITFSPEPGVILGIHRTKIKQIIMLEGDKEKK